jgi:DNA-binding SARP family transcriptional activator/tetratricopeptide (TPR) repeat protein
MRRDVVVRVLGPVRLRAGDACLVPASPQLRLVIGLMALRLGQVVPVAELVDAIWEAEPPRSARASLQALMTRLRRLLKQVPGASLTRVGDGYLLELDDDLVDAERFRSLGRSARAAEGAAGIPLFDAALELWNGPALADAPDTERVRAIRHGLAEEHLAMLQDRLAGMLACGQEREAAAELPAALALHPLNERLAAMLMAARYRSGQRAEALAVFRQIRGRLVAELGVEPGAELQLLHQSILAGDAGLAGLVPGPGQAGGQPPVPAHSLPVPAHSQPVPVNGHPATGNGQPAAAHSQPAAAHSQPAAVNSQPAAAAGQPAAVNGQPGAAAGRPVPVNGHPPAQADGHPPAQADGHPPVQVGGQSPARAGEPAGPASGQDQGAGRDLPVRPWPVPRQLPAAPAQFVDRDAELARLDELIGQGAEPGGETWVRAIVGSPGVGKSALATVWAHRAAGHFPDGQLYVNLKGFGPAARPVTPGQAIRGFLHALGVPGAEIPESPDAQAALYRSVLAGKRVLVLLDNARDADQVRALLPGSGRCAVVITSRDRLDGLVATVGACILTLDVMSQAESRKLIARRLGAARAKAEPEAVADLARLCAGLPLGLAIVAARAAARPGFRLAALSAELGGGDGRLDVLETADTTSSVREVFSWSYRQLSQPAARMFRLLGLHPGPDITVAAAASLSGTGRPQARRALAELTGAHLLTEHMPGRYTLHDLLRAYAAELAAADEDEAGRDLARGRMGDHYLHTAAAAGRRLCPARPAVSMGPVHPGTVPEKFASYAEALGWLGAEHQVLLAVVDAAAAAGQQALAWQLPAVLTDYLNREGHWHDLAATGRTALAAAEGAGDRLGEAHAHAAIGVASLRVGFYDTAHAHLLRASEQFAEAGATAWQARNHLTIGVLLDRRGRHDNARRQAELALSLYKGLGYRAGEAHALQNLGWHLAMLGSGQAAAAHCRRALELHREVGNLIGEAHAWDHLGYAMHLTGDDTEAIACYRRALELLREVRDRAEQGGVLARLGDIYSSVGNKAMAKAVWRRALAILEELHDLGAEEVRSRLAAAPGPAVPSTC